MNIIDYIKQKKLKIVSAGPLKPNKAKKSKSIWKRLFLLCLHLGIVFSIAIFLYVIYCALSMPSINEILNETRSPSIKILDRNNTEIQSISNVYGDTISIEEMPEHLSQALISTEDRDFYNHFGVDLKAITRAFIKNIYNKSVLQGGSTVTQQLSKNLFLSRQRSVKRKVQELLLSLWLEKRFTKQQILELYFNRVSLVGGKYGINVTSKTLFGKPANEMNLYESAIIVAMLKSPSAYNPLKNFEKADKRAKLVLENMVKQGYITKQEATVAYTKKSSFNNKKVLSNTRYFIDFILNDLNSRVGNINKDLIVKTSLDLKFQQVAEKVLSKYLDQYSEEYNLSQGAVLFLDKQGGIIAMIGGKNYSTSQFNRATQARRQVGSTFKPVVYLTALSEGYSVNDIFTDRPVDIAGWTPENYNGQYMGQVSMIEAFSKSLNTVPVIITQKIGLNKVLRTSKRLGLSLDEKKDMSVVLGSNEESLLDMVSAFSVFANGGVSKKSYAIDSVKIVDGNKVFQHYINDINVAPFKINEELDKMLCYAVKYGTGRNANLENSLIKSCGKTGTTKGFRDAWFIGYTDEIIGGVWLGNDDNSRMNSLYGGNLPAKIWKEIIQTYYIENPQN